MDGWVTNSEAKNNSSGEDDDGDHLATAHNFLYHNQSSSVQQSKKFVPLNSH